MSHEIVNSLSPIVGLSKHLKEKYTQKKEAKDYSNNEMEVIQTIDGLKLIEERSSGLNDFISKYRSPTLEVRLNLEMTSVLELAEEMALFFHDQLKSHHFTYKIQVAPDDLQIAVDRKLFTQVLINLIKNSIESFVNHREGLIIFKAFINENNRACIQITDNGDGILAEDIENIFIPFFTKKDGGSGIGLSFSRQIMKLHGGIVTGKQKIGRAHV